MNILENNKEEAGMNRDEILNALTSLDFMSLDMALYLDTHPLDEDAILIYNDTLKQACIAREIYEENFGPICSFRSPSSSTHFGWIDEPNPYETCFNYSLKGDDC